MLNGHFGLRVCTRELRRSRIRAGNLSLIVRRLEKLLTMQKKMNTFDVDTMNIRRASSFLAQHIQWDKVYAVRIAYTAQTATEMQRCSDESLRPEAYSEISCETGTDTTCHTPKDFPVHRRASRSNRTFHGPHKTLRANNVDTIKTVWTVHHQRHVSSGVSWRHAYIEFIHNDAAHTVHIVTHTASAGEDWMN